MDKIENKVFTLFYEAALAWYRDDCMTLGASLSYYAFFSLFPLLLIIFSIIGLVFGPIATGVEQWLIDVTNQPDVTVRPTEIDPYAEVIALFSEIASEETIIQVTDTLRALESSGRTATLVGAVTLFFTASSFFSALQAAFNTIWKAAIPAESTMFRSALSVIQRRFFAFLLVFASAILQFAVMIVRIVIDFMKTYLSNLPASLLFWQGTQFAISFAILTLTILLLFKFLPDAPVAWGDVWIGALITAGLLTLLVSLNSFVIFSLSSSYASYGAVGSVMSLMLWIYLSLLVLFFGAELSQVYAHLYGSYRHVRTKHPLSDSVPSSVILSVNTLSSAALSSIHVSQVALSDVAQSIADQTSRQREYDYYRRKRKTETNRLISATIVGLLLGMLLTLLSLLNTISRGVRAVLQIWRR